MIADLLVSFFSSNNNPMQGVMLAAFTLYVVLPVLGVVALMVVL